MKKLLFIILFFTSIISNAADRYWVGGTADWNATAGSKWATTSGGAGGSSVPTSADNVFFDANSGNAVVTLTTLGSCANLVCTGFTGTLKDNAGSNSLRVSGDITLGSGMQNITDLTIQAFGTGNFNITSNGITIYLLNFFAATTATYTLQDNLTATNDFLLGRGTLDLNGKTASFNRINLSNLSSVRGVTFGSGTLVATGSGSQAFSMSDATSLTLSLGTGTIKMTNTGAKTFGGGGISYPNFWHSPVAGTGTLTITGANTFADFKDDGTAAHTIIFPASTTTTVTSLTLNSSASCAVKTTLNSSTSGTPATISDAAGTNNLIYLSIKDITASGGATFNATNSVDVSGNSGINFSSACPVTANTTNFFFNP